MIVIVNLTVGIVIKLQLEAQLEDSELRNDQVACLRLDSEFLYIFFILLSQRLSTIIRLYSVTFTRFFKLSDGLKGRAAYRRRNS